MTIEDPESEDIPSRLRPLVRPFQSSPFSVAPERQADLVTLRDKYDIRIYIKVDEKDWLFHEFRLGKRIFVGLRTLERLWAYCYGYNAMITELQRAGADGFVGIRNPGEYGLAFQVLEWASQKKLSDVEGPWPDFLPEPGLKDKLEHVEAANHFFLMMSGRLLLHEFAHTILDHHNAPDTPPDILKSEEFAADEWADRWMLDQWEKYALDERVFIGRCLGIALAYAPALILGIDATQPSKSHPSPIERILAFIDRHLPCGNPLERRTIDFPCAFLMTIASHLVFMKTKEPPPNDPIPDTYHDWFVRYAKYFP